MTDVATSEPVLNERRGAALWITLNRPEKFNGLSPDLCAGVHAGLDDAEADPDVRAVVLCGNGKAFCAGADLAHLQRLVDEQHTGVELLEQAEALMVRLEHCRLPVIAVLEGLAAGGGFEVLQCCDIVLMSDRARLADAHANYGLVPGGGATVRLTRLIGPQRAKQLMFTGDFVSAEQALALGFGNEVLPHDDVRARADELVASIAMKSPLGLAHMKQLARDTPDMPVGAALRAERTAVLLHETSFDHQEGMRAFNEKRTPKFEGR